MDAPIPSDCDIFGSLLDILSSEAVVSKVKFVSLEYGTYNEKSKTSIKTAGNLCPS